MNGHFTLHNMRKFHLLVLLFIFPVIIITAIENNDHQSHSRRVVQLTGLVITGDSLKPVPFATVMIKNTRRGTSTDFYGFFSIAARELDTLVFTSVGYKKSHYIVPDTLKESHYSAIQLLTKDTIHLDEMVIYPWPSRRQFRHAFIHTDVPDDDYDRAMENLARAEMKELLENMPMGATANYRHYVNQHAGQLYYAGQRPPMRIFDPIAWSEFIQAWREGRFRRE